MTASAWSPNPTTVTQANAQGVVKQELQYAAASQRIFTLSTFAYAVGTGSVWVIQNGKFLTRNVDYAEVDGTNIMLATPATVGDAVLIIGFVGITGTVTTDAQLRSDLIASSGAGIVNFLAHPTAIARTVAAKLKDRVSVKDFGAVGDGVTDDTLAFQKAADSGFKTIYVPNGTYIVSNLNDRIRISLIGESKRSTVIKQKAGTVGELITLETGVPNGPYVVGDITEGAQVFHNIGFYVVGNCGIRASTARANTLVLDNIRMLHADSDFNPYNPTAGTISLDLQDMGADTASFLPVIRDSEFRSWDNGIKFGSGSNDFMVVGGWFINCRNSVRIKSCSVGYICTCIETNVNGAYGVYFIGGNSNNVTITTTRFELTGVGGSAIAFDATASNSYGIFNQNPYYLLAGGITATVGSIPTSYLEMVMTSGTDPSFASGTKALSLPPVIKMYTAGAGINSTIKGYRNDGPQMFEIGFITSGNVFYRDNKNGGSHNFRVNGTDYAIINQFGLTPGVDNTEVLGSSSLRWSTVYAGSATINTSDQTHKQQIGTIPEAAFKALTKINWVQFKFNEAVERKGDANARWHFGVIAQQVKEAFESEGLDPFAYGILCYDEWDDKYADIIDEATGEVVGQILVQAAGKIYGVRYEELHALACTYLMAKALNQ